MNTVYRYIIKLIIFFTTFSMVSAFYNESCYFCLICALAIIVYSTYRIIDKILKFDLWGDTIASRSTDEFVVYGNKKSGYYNNTYESNSNHNIFFEGKNKYCDDIKDIASKFKVNEDKIEIVETTVKEVIRPITKVNPMFETKANKKEKKMITTNKVDDNKPVINPSEFNKDVIMLVNDNKLSKDVSNIYDCIISALKDCNLATSAICMILQAFQYIDLFNNQAIIYVNERQIEGVVLSKVKRKIITNINEKFNNNIKTVFTDLKYISVFDYFNKNNEV